MTILGVTFSAAVLWLFAAGILAILEAFTLGLTSIWFAGGAAGASIATMLGASLPVQIVVFLVISIVLIAVTRPLAKKRLNAKVEKTNIDAVLGQEGMVEKAIPSYGSGQVRADGKSWTAVSTGGEIEEGKIVIIKSVRGVTLTVEEKED